jgi:hypothetical protein
MKRLVVALVGLGALAWACGSSPPPKPPMKADEPLASETADDPDASAKAWAHEESDGGGAAPAAGGASQGNEEGAKALLAQFVAPNADHAALTKSLKPTSADYKALFDEATAPKIESAQAKDWESGKAAIKPGEGQTEVKIAGATGADLAAGKGAAKEFPGGYKKVAKHLTPTVTFFRFKFVKPGEENGTAYDGLAFVNNHWVIAPKPFRALEGKGGGLDEAPGTDDAAPAKKGGKPGKGKPKGKKK